MPTIVDFENVSLAGLEASPVAAALAGLRASESAPPGFKLSDGMDVPVELEGKFKFARQKSKLAGTIRGSYLVIKGEY